MIEQRAQGKGHGAEGFECGMGNVACGMKKGEDGKVGS